MLKSPSVQTLRKYGLSEKLWYNILDSQGGICPVCEREFTEKLRPVTDHFHAQNYKKMKPEKKRLHVRGLLCNYCNRRRVAKGMNTKMAYNIYKYLDSHDKRKTNG